MPPAAPPFPAFDEWRRMSEREQDAWLDRLERKKRRGRLTLRLVVGLAVGAAVAAAALAALLLWSVG